MKTLQTKELDENARRTVEKTVYLRHSCALRIHARAKGTVQTFEGTCRQFVVSLYRRWSQRHARKKLPSSQVIDSSAVSTCKLIVDDLNVLSTGSLAITRHQRVICVICHQWCRSCINYSVLTVPVVFTVICNQAGFLS